MLDAARRDGYAYPAVNVSSSTTLNAALAGFADARSDGIVQLTPSGADFASGTAADAVAGARALAAFAREVADDYPVLIALHTDHCPPAKVDAFLRPLLEESAARVRRDEPPLYQSHMFDGSSLPLAENLELAAEILETCREANVILEIEIGVVGGEEDGLDARVSRTSASTARRQMPSPLSSASEPVSAADTSSPPPSETSTVSMRR
jgi:fructose-bisphosphate aldolase, class II